MKLNKNKVLSAFQAKETALNKQMAEAKQKDDVNFLAYAQGKARKYYQDEIRQSEAEISVLESRLAEAQKNLAEYREVQNWLKAPAKNKKNLLERWSQSSAHYNGFNNARGIQARLDRLAKQKTLVKLTEGDTIDSKVVDIDLSVLD